MNLRVNQWFIDIYSFSCLHFDTRSNHLLNNLSFSLNLLTTSFFKRQRLHDFDLEDFLKMDYWISNSLFWSFKLQINFESSRSFSCVRFLNVIVWLLYLDVNSVSLIPSLVSMSNGQFCFCPYNCMFYNLCRFKNLLSLCYDYGLRFLYYLCNYN